MREERGVRGRINSHLRLQYISRSPHITFVCVCVEYSHACLKQLQLFTSETYSCCSTKQNKQQQQIHMYETHYKYNMWMLARAHINNIHAAVLSKQPTVDRFLSLLLFFGFCSLLIRNQYMCVDVCVFSSILIKKLDWNVASQTSYCG